MSGQARLLDVRPAQSRIPVGQRDCWDCRLGTPGPTVGEAICGARHRHYALDAAVDRGEARVCSSFRPRETER